MRTPIALILLIGATGPLPAAEPPARADSYGDPLPAVAIARLGTVRNRAPITSFGVRADEMIVTAGGGDGIVDLRVWSSGDDTGSEPRRLKTNWEEKVYSPAVSADGKRIAASTTERLVVWDIADDGTTKQVAAYTAERPGNFRFSSDGSSVVFARSWGSELVVCVGDIKTGKSLELEGALNYVAATAVSADGKRVAASTAFEVHVWDAKTGERLARHELGKVYAQAVALDPTGRTLAVNVGGAAAVKLLDAVTGKPVEKLTGPKGGSWVAFAPDGKTLLVGDTVGVRWWDPAAGKLLRAFDGFEGTARGWGGLEYTPARFSADSKTLVAASTQALHRWEAGTGKPLFPVPHAAGHFAEITALGVSADGNKIATTGPDGRLRVWGAANGKPLMNVSGNAGYATNVEFSPDGKSVYGASGRFALARWEIATGKEGRQFGIDPKLAEKLADAPGLAGYRVTPDGKALVAVHNGFRLDVLPLMTTWNTETGERIASVELDQTWTMVMSRARLTFSPDGKFATTCGNAFPTGDGPKGNTLGDRVLGPGFEPGAFSGDGTLIAYSVVKSQGNRQTYRAQVYDPVTGRKITELSDGSGGRVALSPDGKMLAAAGLEDLTFWDVFSSELLARFKSPPADRGPAVISFANAIRFSPDGTFVVTAHADTTALVWLVPRRAK